MAKKKGTRDADEDLMGALVLDDLDAAAEQEVQDLRGDADGPRARGTKKKKNAAKAVQNASQNQNQNVTQNQNVYVQAPTAPVRGRKRVPTPAAKVPREVELFDDDVEVQRGETRDLAFYVPRDMDVHVAVQEKAHPERGYTVRVMDGRERDAARGPYRGEPRIDDAASGPFARSYPVKRGQWYLLIANMENSHRIALHVRVTRRA